MQETKGFNNLIVKCDGFTLRFEYNSDYVIGHIKDIDKFTKEVFFSLQHQVETWSEFLKAMGHQYLWAAVPKEDKKIQRLLSGLKFKYISQQDGLAVYRYGV
jgi:hypothetical protein